MRLSLPGVQKFLWNMFRLYLFKINLAWNSVSLSILKTCLLFLLS